MIENKTTKLIEDNKIEEALRELKKEVEENEKLFKEHDISIDEIVNLVRCFKGKKEGIAEQAARDEKKFNDMHQQHENDRKRWNEEKQAYEDLLDEAENKL